MATARRNSHSAIESDVDALIETGKGQTADPYLQLWAAVFHLGLRDFCQALLKGQHRAKAYTWFWSEDVCPGSFCWLCYLLGLDIAQVRQRTLDNQQALARGPRGATKRESKHEDQ